LGGVGDALDCNRRARRLRAPKRCASSDRNLAQQYVKQVIPIAMMGEIQRGTER
jgi:hypothetical protein